MKTSVAREGVDLTSIKWWLPECLRVFPEGRDDLVGREFCPDFAKLGRVRIPAEDIYKPQMAMFFTENVLKAFIIS